MNGSIKLCIKSIGLVVLNIRDREKHQANTQLTLSKNILTYVHDNTFNSKTDGRWPSSGCRCR